MRIAPLRTLGVAGMLFLLSSKQVGKARVFTGRDVLLASVSVSSTTIVGSKTAQIVLNHPKERYLQAQHNQSFPLIPGDLAALLGSPEKAGVGGSIPSLALIAGGPQAMSLDGE